MLRLLPTLALLTFATSALGHVVEKDVHEFYDVKQFAGVSLLDALNSASPVRQNGQTFHGYTEWDVRWNFRWQVSNAGLCEIVSVTTNLTVKTTLPKLVIGTQEAVAQFNKYYAALAIHEQGHRKNALDAAKQIDRAIAGLRPMPDCQSLESEANRTGHAQLESAKLRDIEYDAKTQFGCTQGACLLRTR